MSLQTITRQHTVDVQIEMRTGGAVGSLTRWGDGTVVDAYTAVDLPCTVQPVAAREATELLKQGVRIDYAVYFSEVPQVDARHRFVWVDRGDVRHYLHVRRGPIDAGGQGRIWKVLCEEQQDVQAPA